MDLRVEGTRPQSGRHTSNRNPITGEEMPFTPRARQPQQSARPHSRPDGVPSLSLGGLTTDDKDSRPIELDPYHYKLDSPNTASTVSWGTPGRSAHKQQAQKPSKKASSRPGDVPGLNLGGDDTDRGANIPIKQKQPTAWDKQPVPENLPPPSQRYKQQYQQYEQDMKDSYRKQSARSFTQSEIDDHIEKLQLDVPLFDGPIEDDGESHDIQKVWTANPYSREHIRKKTDVEDLEADKRKFKLLETVMIDQLSRPVISDPAQDAPHSARANPAYHPMMKKGPGRNLHSSRVRTSGSATENLLSRSVQFSARLLTRCSRDAIRELAGFFFAVDNSLTIYEFRQFGKSAKALPFIKRGTYSLLNGPREGQPYTLRDIQQNLSLAFESKEQVLPGNMSVQPIIVFKICDVDDPAKSSILLDGVSVHEREDVWKRAHLPATQTEIKEQLLLNEVQSIVKHQIQKRGIRAWRGMGHLLRQLDQEGDGRLNKYELEKALVDYHIDVPNEKFDDLWDTLDRKSTSFLEYDVFMRAYLGEMSENRKTYVRKAYLKVDSAKKGTVRLDDLKKFYNTNRHPKVKSGECTEDQVMSSFTQCFTEVTERGQVDYAEFEEYYEGLSLSVDSDEDFINILRNSWGI